MIAECSLGEVHCMSGEVHCLSGIILSVDTFGTKINVVG